MKNVRKALIKKSKMLDQIRYIFNSVFWASPVQHDSKTMKTPTKNFNQFFRLRQKIVFGRLSIQNCN